MSAYLVVFGAAVKEDGTASGSLERRVRGALDFARSAAQPCFIATGGQGRYGPPEAWVIREMLLAAGVAPDRILIEDQARDTLESVVLCSKLLSQRNDVEFVVPCTSRYHLPRCALLFRLAGFRVEVPPMPEESQYLGRAKWARYLLKEVIAIPYDALLLLGRIGRSKMNAS